MYAGVRIKVAVCKCALNGAILASSDTLAQAAERMTEIWSHLGNSKVLNN